MVTNPRISARSTVVSTGPASSRSLTSKEAFKEKQEMRLLTGGSHINVAFSRRDGMARACALPNRPLTDRDRRLQRLVRLPWFEPTGINCPRYLSVQKRRS